MLLTNVHRLSLRGCPSPVPDAPAGPQTPVGVILCTCAGTLAQSLDLEAVAAGVRLLPGVGSVAVRGVLCSPDGLSALTGEAVARGWKRVVIGACTPEEHGEAIRAALGEAGINPYLVAQANLREQCAWVGEDAGTGVDKGVALVAAAVARVREQQPLRGDTVPARTEVAVLGAGAAGVAAALALADGGRRVVLVERRHALGGRAYRYPVLHPEGECGSCRLAPSLDQVLHHPDIEVLTGATATRCRGREGDFRVEIGIEPRGVSAELCLGCGACGDACPVTVPGGGAAIRPPFEGALPSVPVVDPAHCLLRLGEACERCSAVCPTGAARPGQPGESREVAVGAVVLATGFDTFDPDADPRFGYPGGGRVWTATELELCLAAVASGEMPLEVGGVPPGRVALVHCVGSRSERFHSHCSGICCAALGKHARQLAGLLPGVRIVDLHVGHCLPGTRQAELFHGSLQVSGAVALQRRSADEVEVVPAGDCVRLRYARPDGVWAEEQVDLVVLAPALLGSVDATRLAAVFGIDLEPEGWFAGSPELLASHVSSRPGVFLAGCCRAPGDVAGAVADALAATGQVCRSLVPGRTLALDPEVAVVDGALCSGCAACRAACDFGAVTLEARRVAMVDETLCRGCGSCAAACPVGAVQQRHSTDREVRAETAALLGSG